MLPIVIGELGSSPKLNKNSCLETSSLLEKAGDSGAVKQAIIAARDVGLQLLKALAPDEELKSTTTPYIL